MTLITNCDSGERREAEIVTRPGAALNWCIAAWPAPHCGKTRVDGNGHGWQVVRLQGDGSYVYNDTMLGGFADCLGDIHATAARAGYTLA